MSLVESSIQDRRPSDGASLTLPSNNPFRNRAASPSSLLSEPSPQSPTFKSRPVSRNPFLDSVDAENHVVSPQSPRSPNKAMSNPTGGEAAPGSGLSNGTLDIFKNLSVNDKQSPTGPLPTQARQRPGPESSRRRPSISQENRGSAAPASSTRLQAGLDIFADPSESTRSRENRRVRRNSDSSVRSGKLLGPEEDRRRRERRHREGRMRDGKPRDKHPRGSPKAKKPNHRLDIIDKLDVTSIYGTGLFHHDGPFDACNPHRNRKDSSRAPMQAFPKDSANNALGGSGPLNKDIDHNLFHGNRGAEAFSDFSKSGTEVQGYEPYTDLPARPTAERSQSFQPSGLKGSGRSAFNVMARVDPVHGDESLGLGTSTFLEGAPASRTAIKRRESESDTLPTQGGGLGRTKSLAQKIRGMNSVRQQNRPIRRVSPEQREMGAPRSTPRDMDRPFSSGDGARQADQAAINDEYDAAYDQKGEVITVAQRETNGRERAMSSPRDGLERRATNDGAGASYEATESKPVGFLARVKSLKGGRRAARPGERAF